MNYASLRSPLAALLLSVCLGLAAGLALASQIVTLTLTAGEAYVIKNVDPGSAPAVSFSDNSNSFTVKNSGPNSLTVFTFQKGEGTIDAKVAGEDVTYHVIVGGVFNAAHPLRPETAPDALTRAGHAETSQPAPYAPANAAVASAPLPASTQPPAGAAPAAAAPVGAPPESGTGPVVANSATTDGGYSNDAGTTKTEVVGPTAFSSDANGGAEYAPGFDGPNSPSAGSPPLNPNVGGSYGTGWREQAPSVVSQQFSTDPRRLRPEGYVNNLAFGGRHNLPPETINITSGTSQVFDFGGPISRVSMANTKVADLQVLGNHQLMVVGHDPGFGSLVVWDSQGNYIERQIWTEIAGHQQVMLHVIVAEVDLNKIQQQGIDIAVALKNIGLTFVSLPGGVASPYTSPNRWIWADCSASGRPTPLPFAVQPEPNVHDCRQQLECRGMVLLPVSGGARPRQNSGEAGIAGQFRAKGQVSLRRRDPDRHYAGADHFNSVQAVRNFGDFCTDRNRQQGHRLCWSGRRCPRPTIAKGCRFSGFVVPRPSSRAALKPGPV